MKIILVIFIVLVVLVGGYFIFKSVSKPAQVVMSPSPTATETPPPSPTPTPTPVLPAVINATIQTARGNIDLELYSQIAPKTVQNFVTLAQQGFYDGTKFHRVVADFVIQGGDPLSKTNDPNVGTGGPGYTFADEINPKAQGLTDDAISALEAQGYTYDFSLASMPVKVGIIAMANSGPNTNGSQFFIVTTKDQPQLNGKHTVFGKVTKGMNVVKLIKQGDVITKITVVIPSPSSSVSTSPSPSVSASPTNNPTPIKTPTPTK